MSPSLRKRPTCCTGRNDAMGRCCLKRPRFSVNSASPSARDSRRRFSIMGRQAGDQSQLFYLFYLERRIPTAIVPRRINPVVTRILAELREKLVPFDSEIGRPSVDPELMIRMLIVGYSDGIRFERRLCEKLNFTLRTDGLRRLDLDEEPSDHSMFSVNRHGRFRDSDILREVLPGCGAGRAWMLAWSGRGVCRRCQRDGGQCQPLSRQDA